MTANELRIGNLVILQRPFYTFKKGDVFKLSNVGVDYLDRWQEMGASDELEITDISPIPLTEEWLVRFGFEESSWGWYILGVNQDFELIYENNMSVFFNEVSERNSIGIKFGHIKHVHQLQNLYFALTGEELQCKA